MLRIAVASCIVLLSLGGSPPPAPSRALTSAANTESAATSRAPLGYVAPVPIEVVRRFQPPPTPYAAGHRGVDLASATGTMVHAAAPGRVAFAGSVAGRGVVVIAHPDGVSTEYEPVTAAVRTGATVAGGQLIGSVQGRHGGCAPGRCLHWGARRGGSYFDPLELLTGLGPVRLLPWTY